MDKECHVLKLYMEKNIILRTKYCFKLDGFRTAIIAVSSTVGKRQAVPLRHGRLFHTQDLQKVYSKMNSDSYHRIWKSYTLNSTFSKGKVEVPTR